MSSIAMDLLARPASVPPDEPDTLPTRSAAEATGLTLRSETTNKERTDAAEPAQETGDASGKPPARAVHLPAAVGTTDGFKRGNK